MDTNATLELIEVILENDSSLSSIVDNIALGYREVPLLKTEVMIRAENPTNDKIQPFGCNRFTLPVVIEILQRNVKMYDSDVILNDVIDNITRVLEEYQRLTADISLDYYELDREMVDTEVQHRNTEIIVYYDVIELR